jgi:hypothetical protein
VCAAALPAFKAPKAIVLAKSLPKTERGKLDRKALVERWTKQIASPLEGEAGERSEPGGGLSSLATPLPNPPHQGGRQE